MIGRADIEGSKSNVAMNAWLPQASYPCGHAFTVCIRTENQNQVSFCPFALHEVSVLAELTLGHLRYDFTDVPPQSNSPPDTVIRADPGRLIRTPQQQKFPQLHDERRPVTTPERRPPKQRRGRPPPN
ncbi:DgyrCDS3254 [Dimorphilus gyrociliatus]|uniref:DgyrCDS3252 n=1 Tax=Dimorphilus gyrociliatus TaxID=2664684 RepID=A0A7I8VHR2_9ANNE|nr:DgyrCDS3252 [Dimorphilus gyrociliatus]CAD5114109.1 DgyrCDS3254 [Dimorphilus gyrociliatus]